MKVVYDGPQAARDVKLPGGGLKRVERGKPVDLPEGVAKSLTRQAYWRKYEAPRTRSQTATRTTTRKEGDRL